MSIGEETKEGVSKWPAGLKEVFAKLVEVLDDVLEAIDALGDAVEKTLPMVENELACINAQDDSHEEWDANDELEQVSPGYQETNSTTWSVTQ